MILVCDWKKWNRGGGTRCEESGSIEGQSQCEIWSSEYWLGVHLPHDHRVVCKIKQNKPGFRQNSVKSIRLGIGYRVILAGNSGREKTR